MAWSFIAILIVAAILVPVLSLGVSANSPFYLPPYLVQLLGKYLCYAILAVALDLVWGYCGILSLGHGAFFALGGYAMGMYLMRQIGTRGVYANPILPDFMVFLNWKELPVAWWGFNWFPYAMAMVVLVPGLLALAFGWFAFRSRVTGVYLSIITQAMTFALFKEFFRNDFGFGGNNGLTDFKDLLGFSLQSASTKAALFSASAIVLILAYVASRAIIGSKYGKALVAVRDAESRMRFLGYRVANYKLFVFVVSAIIAGIAGALYVPQVGIINPSEFAPGNSIEAAIWVAVGGRGTLIGAAIGAIAVNFAKTFFTGAFPEYWLYGLGLLFVLTTLFLPKGLLGLALKGARAATAPSRAGRGHRGRRRTVNLAETANPTLTQSLLYLDGVSVSFDGYKALRSLSLMLQPGEMRAIIGPNGAGKTTMMDVITGKTRPDEGEVMFDGRHDLTKLDEAEIATLGVGRKFQKPTVFENHTVEDNLLLATKAPRSVRATLFGREDPKTLETIDVILATTRLADHRARIAGSLSHGQKQWLEIGMLLAQDPKLLLVDEPVAGMTDAETAATADLLREIARDHSVIVVEHDMHFVRELGVKVTCLHEGSVLAEGTLDQVSADPRVVEVYLGR